MNLLPQSPIVLDYSEVFHITNIEIIINVFYNTFANHINISYLSHHRRTWHMIVNILILFVYWFLCRELFVFFDIKYYYSRYIRDTET